MIFLYLLAVNENDKKYETLRSVLLHASMFFMVILTDKKIVMPKNIFDTKTIRIRYTTFILLFINNVTIVMCGSHLLNVL